MSAWDSVLMHAAGVIAQYPVFLTGVLGMFTSSLNIAVFTVQGFKNSVNISLMALASWDLVKCMGGVAYNAREYFTVPFSFLASVWNAFAFCELAYVQILANYTSYPIAAYLAIERALCVTAPFKVKSIFTPTLTSTVMLLVSFTVPGMFTFVFFNYEIAYKTDPLSNRTIATYEATQFLLDHGAVPMAFYNAMGIIIPVASLIIICVCTAVISYQLHQASAFRSKARSGSKNTPQISARDKQVIKMLLVVIGVFIFNLIPRAANQIAKLVEPEFYPLKDYHAMFMLCVNMVYFFDLINGSINFFIFLTMNSQFKETLFRMFCCPTRNVKSSLT